MAAPVSADLAELLGRDVDSQQGAAVLSIVTAMVRTYCQGAGFTDSGPVDEIRAIILSAACRLIAHPRQIPMSEAVGPESVDYRGGFAGFTLAERAVLDEFRVTALG